MMSRQRVAFTAAVLAISAMAPAAGSAADGQISAPSSQVAMQVAGVPMEVTAAAPTAEPHARARARAGYYRFPAIHGDVVVFTAEGDLWRTTTAGGVATRLTTHASEELRPSISPDGQWLAYSASYEGPRDVYVMPLSGGPPVRQSWDGDADVVGWTADGRVLYATQRYSTLPNVQVIAVRPCLPGDDALALGARAAARADRGGAASPDSGNGAGAAAVASRAASSASSSASDSSTHPCSPSRSVLPLAQAADGVFDDAGTFWFTRLPFQGSHTKRYRGGTAQNLWAWAGGSAEARPVTADWDGTSKTPMVWGGRVYFASDRDGVMNLWSMASGGGDLRQHTHHADYDVQSPALHDGRIVYQSGADLWLYDTARDTDLRLDIQLASDFDQMRENWVDRPMSYLTSVHLSPNGDRVVLTSRGRVFVAPVGPGRLVQATRRDGVRYRDATFLSSDRLVALSDESGEVEVWTLPANGIGGREQLTDSATILRWAPLPSPDGKLVAHHDKNQNLFIHDVAAGTDVRIATNPRMSAWISSAPGFFDMAWSPDGRWLAYNDVAPNYLGRIVVYDTRTGAHVPVTSDRYDSYSPAWSPDGRFLYFLSDRHFATTVGSPWGARQPDPFFDRQTSVYAVSLRSGLSSPFRPRTELDARARASDDRSSASDSAARRTASSDASGTAGGAAPATPVEIDTAGIVARLFEVPVPAGNYSTLTTDGRRLYYLSLESRSPRKVNLVSIEISNDEPKPAPVIEDVQSYELSADGKKLLVRKGNDLHVFDAGAKAPTNLAESRVDLSGWSFSVNPREEWLHHFEDAWRLERDYFYDPGMHGLNWPAMREKYRPLAERVTDRAELNDVIAQMVGELSALHIFVRGGDQREGTDDVAVGSLGAVLVRDSARGGWRVEHIYPSDPDIPGEVSPLAQPGVEVSEGDVIISIDGVPTLGVADPAVLLRASAGKQVLLRVVSGEAGARARARAGSSASSGRPPGGSSAAAEWDVVVTPITLGRERDLRYDAWEYTRRLAVDSMSGGRIGYVHLRAMGGGNMAEWMREYYPVANRDGLIIDVRHNSGGNIDSWLLGKLLRREWFWWQPRVGEPYHNMPYAFRGPIVVLVNERTASDGEAFAEGFRRLGLGKVIGVRTWGGEIWLSSNNFLADRGIATAAEQGVFADGEWLIEGWGVDPDIVVDNLPVETGRGRDAQLEKAIEVLRAEMAAAGDKTVVRPRYPGKN